MDINLALTEVQKHCNIFAQILLLPPHQLCFAVIDKHCSFHCIVRSYYTLYFYYRIIFPFYNVLYSLSSNLYIQKHIWTYNVYIFNKSQQCQTFQYAIIEIQPLRVLVDIDLSEIYLTFLYLFQSMPQRISKIQHFIRAK